MPCPILDGHPPIRDSYSHRDWIPIMAWITPIHLSLEYHNIIGRGISGSIISSIFVGF